MIQFSTAVCNSRVRELIRYCVSNSIQYLAFGRGTPPVNCAAPGTNLIGAVDMMLYGINMSNWAGMWRTTFPVSGGIYSQNIEAAVNPFPITTSAGVSNAIPTYFRIQSSAGVAHMQGTVSAPGEGGDMELSPVNSVSGRAMFKITKLQISDANLL